MTVRLCWWNRRRVFLPCLVSQCFKLNIPLIRELLLPWRKQDWRLQHLELLLGGDRNWCRLFGNCKSRAFFSRRLSRTIPKRRSGLWSSSSTIKIWKMVARLTFSILPWCSKNWATKSRAVLIWECLLLQRMPSCIAIRPSMEMWRRISWVQCCLSTGN